MIRGLANRLEAYTEKRGPDDCWEWMGVKIRGGYGQLFLRPRDRAIHSSRLVHRIVYERQVGPIPDGLTIDHLCGNPSCVNPHHLEAVPMRTNIQRGGNAKKTHCSQGHPYDEANTYLMPSGGRDCRICINRRSKEYRQRKSR